MFTRFEYAHYLNSLELFYIFDEERSFAGLMQNLYDSIFDFIRNAPENHL